MSASKIVTLTIVEVHCLEKNVNCPDKLSRPRNYADVPGKQVQVPNCDNVSATSDNHNLGKKLHDTLEHESLIGRERFLSDVKVVAYKVFCLDIASAHIFCNLKQMGPRTYQSSDNESTNEMVNASLTTKGASHLIFGLRSY